jgi:hypothetical protein
VKLFAPLAEQVAREIGLKIHAQRREISVESCALPLGEAVARELVSHNTPVVVAGTQRYCNGG